MNSITEQAYRYLYTAGRTARMLCLAPVAASERDSLNAVARQLGYRDPRLRPELRPIDLHDVVPPTTQVQLRAPEGRDGNVSVYELFCIASVVAELRPATSFEIGTFNGRTALNIAANSPAGSVTYTLDLPATEEDSAALPLEMAERKYVDKPVSGELIPQLGAGLDIRQVYGDSATYDFGDLRGAVDFVFVDGSHSYEYVKSDSARALELLRGGKGVILWHDYGGWVGVTRALDELRASGGVWSGLRWINGTSLAYLRVG